MKLYVGITDSEWFRYLRSTHADEMNFWRPRATSQFKALEPGELFLFKSKYPYHRIIGGAFFVRHTTLSLDLAWKAFGTANGTDSLDKLRRMIQGHRKDNDLNPIIGCTILTQPFYLDDNATIDPPSDWSGNIVSAKRFTLQVLIAFGKYSLCLLKEPQAFAAGRNLVTLARHNISRPIRWRVHRCIVFKIERLSQDCASNNGIEIIILSMTLDHPTQLIQGVGAVCSYKKPSRLDQGSGLYDAQRRHRQ